MSDADEVGDLRWRLSWATDDEIRSVVEVLGVGRRARLEDIAVRCRINPEALFVLRSERSVMIAIDDVGTIVWAAANGRDLRVAVGCELDLLVETLDLREDHAAALQQSATRRERTSLSWGGEQRDCHPFVDGRGSLLVVTTL